VVEIRSGKNHGGNKKKEVKKKGAKNALADKKRRERDISMDASDFSPHYCIPKWW
jgi:hypothetical protein